MRPLAAQRTFWAAWLMLLAAKAWLAARVPLFVDEAWYWLEGQHPALAYSDLPGLTAWLARLGVELGGHSWLGLRWPFLLLAMAVPLLVRASAARLAGATAGDQAGTLALVLPLLGSAGLLALPDVPLTFAAALCLYAGVRLLQGIDRIALAALAVGLVLGALSHYRFAPIVAAGLFGLLLEPAGRAVLRDARVRLALLLGAAAWLPLLHWNLRHGGAGWAFQLGERHPWQPHAEGVFLPLSQLAVVGPLLLALLLAALPELARRRRAGETGAGLLWGAALLPLALYLPLAFFADRERVSFHWLLQAWLPLLVAAPWVWQRWPAWLRRATAATSVVLLAAALGYYGIAASPAARAALADRALYPENFTGFDEAVAWLRAEPPPPGAALVADNFMLGAQLGFALRRSDLPVLDHPLNHKHGRAAQLALWGLQARLGAPRGAVTLLMDDGMIQLRRRLAHYRGRCAEAGGLASPRVLAVDHGRRRFLRFDLPASSTAPPACVLPAVAWLDAPTPGDRISRGPLAVAGWAFKDGAGLRRIEVTLDGRVVAQATAGRPAPHVATYWDGSSDPDQPDVGFAAELDLRDVPPGVHWLGLRLHGRDGSVEPWAEQRLRVAP
jgi:4-amino-4-deoxy-L-arabinose transferase-like glycosyltransferase